MRSISRYIFLALLALGFLLPVVATSIRPLARTRITIKEKRPPYNFHRNKRAHVGMDAGSTTNLVSALFRDRLSSVEAQIPAITDIAEDIVDHQSNNPGMRIRYPWPLQLAFSDEFIARSGALGNWACYFESDMVPGPDLMIYGVRSWEKDAAEAAEVLSNCRSLGWKTILIASSSGMPSGLQYDYFIDNFAPSGSNYDGAINIMVNCALGWLWQDEYVAACTRKFAAHPGILMSAWYPEAAQFDNDIMLDPTRMYTTDAKIPAGQLSTAYIERLKWLVDEVESTKIQGQIEYAADLIAERMKSGGVVGVSTLGHASTFEVFLDVKSPFKPFHAAGSPSTSFKDELNPGDMLLWISYIGVGTDTRYYYDYDGYIREAGLDLISCFTPDDTEPANNGPDALAHIDQSWPIGDAEVPIPFAPNRISPMSAINQMLIFRMIDDAVALRL